VRALVRDDIRSAAATLARAFDEDPLYRFLLPERPRRRRRWLELIMARALFDCVPAALRLIARAHPSEPHYYLVAFGVHPDRKGRGLGRQLLSHGLAHADREGIPAYLETSNEANLGLYARFGFVQLEQLDPGRGAPPIWTMRREPS
jgi:GNAT superfamily N-acetyltransferase